MSATLIEPDIPRIRALNDAFRSTFVGGAVVVTPGIETLDDETRRELLQAVRDFSTFDHGNDPYMEHDFGEVTLGGAKFFWKIDCYDRRCQFASPNPADPEVTTRVLTVMRAEEY